MFTGLFSFPVGVMREVSKNDSVILIEHNEFNSIVEKEFSRSDNISIILSSSRASFSTLQHIIDSNINKKLNIRILIKSPDALNDTRQALVISNVLKWFELKKNNNIKVAVKMYSDHEILRCYIFDNSRILAGIYSYKDTITECNSKNIQCERHRFYGHNYMLYYTGHNDRVGNFLLEKYQNQFEFMWSNSTSFNISDHTL